MRSVGILIKTLIALAITYFYSNFAYEYVMSMNSHYLVKMGAGCAAAFVLLLIFSALSLVVNPDEK